MLNRNIWKAQSESADGCDQGLPDALHFILSCASAQVKSFSSVPTRLILFFTALLKGPAKRS